MTWPQPPTQTQPPTSAAPPPACLFCGNAVPPGCGLCPHCGSSLGSAAATWTLQDPHHDQWASPPAPVPPNTPVPSVLPGAGTPFGPPAAPADSLYQHYTNAYSVKRPNRRLRILIGIAAAVGAVAVVAAVAGNTGPKSDGPNGIFHSGPAHFSAQFPNVPSTHALTETIDGAHFTENIVVDSQSFTEVLEIASPPGLFSAEANTILTAESREITVSTGWTLGDSESTTFEGSPAQQTSYTASDGSQFTSIMFVYQGSRVYMLVAPAGDPFNVLSSSFTITG